MGSGELHTDPGPPQPLDRIAIKGVCGLAVADQRSRVRLAPARPVRAGPSLSTSGETLTIEELMTLRARTENAGDVGVEHEWSWGSG